MAARLAKKNAHGPIIILTTMVMIHTATAVLDIPDGNLERGARADEIVDACATSTYVTVPVVDITLARGNITAYKLATPATRPNLWRIVHNDLKALMRLFQQAADNTVADAVAIIESGGFKVKKIPLPQKHVFKVENNAVSGSVDLEAEGGPAHSCHDWMYSPDGTNWERMTPTVFAHAHKDGLTPKADAYFTHELITEDGPQGISQVFHIIVT